MFIKLTTENGNSMFFNIYNINNFTNHKNGTVVSMPTEQYLWVKETPEEILKLIKECER
jgi:uncharacterized protein YlzI (FlbEa/FlbD family)